MTILILITRAFRIEFALIEIDGRFQFVLGPAPHMQRLK